jgi:hypothetical protein
VKSMVAVCAMGVIALFGVVAHGSGPGDDSTSPEVAYLGQQPPGRSPEVFGRGVISEAGYLLHGPVVFSPDMRDVYWAVIPPAIMWSSFVEEGWSEPQPLQLKGRGVQSPAVSADGARLYYQAVGEKSNGNLEIWWVDRTPEGWGEPVNAGPLVNSDRLQSQPCLAADGTLYYTGTLQGVEFERGIYRSRLIEGEYGSPELLSGGINSEHINYCPWVARDESYLLFASSRPRAEEPLYLHVSFRLGDGSWSEPQGIHEALGFEAEARFPSVSPDGRYLFFISGDAAYWVDIAPVLELSPRAAR